MHLRKASWLQPEGRPESPLRRSPTPGRTSDDRWGLPHLATQRLLPASASRRLFDHIQPELSAGGSDDEFVELERVRAGVSERVSERALEITPDSYGRCAQPCQDSASGV
jgi:hypothetical protein